MVKNKAIRFVRRAQPAHRLNKSKRPPNRKSKPEAIPPGAFGLQEKTLPHRRFVEFPLMKGKVAEKVQLFVTQYSQSLTIEFQDQTSLHLSLEPNLTINARLQKDQNGDLETLAEWPGISTTDV